MKVKVQVYQPQEGNALPKLPTVLENMRELFMQDAVKCLRIFGIAKTTIKPTAVGIRTVNDVSCKFVQESLPAPILALQKTVARQMAEFMLSFGVTEIELAPIEEEMVQVRDLWEQLKLTKAETTVKGPSALKHELPLNIEPDPSGKSVLNEKSDIDTQGRTEQVGESTDQSGTASSNPIA